MLKPKALMESISSNLYDFLKKISTNLSLPDKKFLRDATIGLLGAGNPIVCQMARHLHEISEGGFLQVELQLANRVEQGKDKDQQDEGDGESDQVIGSGDPIDDGSGFF